MSFVVLGALVLLAVYGLADAHASQPDFEWLTPSILPVVYDETSFWKATLDPVTGDTYCFVVNYTLDTPQEQWLWCFHYNRSTRGFERMGVNPITDSTGLWDCCVYDGQTYMLYSGRSGPVYLHLSIDRREAYDFNVVIQPYTNFKILGFYRGRMHIELLYFQNQSYNHDIFSIDPVSLDWKMTSFFSVQQNKTIYTGVPTWSILRDGRCYCPYVIDNSSEINSSLRRQLWLWSCDLDDPHPEGPIILLKGVVGMYWGDAIDIDSRGDIHLFDRRAKMLFKYSPQGELLAVISVSPRFLEEAIWDYAVVFVNQTDHVFILGLFRPNHTPVEDEFLCAVVRSDYSSDPSFSSVAEIGPVGLCWAVDSRLHTVQVVLRTTVNGILRYALSYPIKPSPDLMVMPESFTFENHTGSETPDELSFLIMNRGYVPSEWYWVRIDAFPQNASECKSVGDVLRIETVAPESVSQFGLTVEIPHGTYRIVIELHDVTPFENIRSNNILEVWVYVPNHAPELVVTEPVDGQWTSVPVRATGSVSDLDGDAPITIVIEGLPGPAIEVLINGDWSLELVQRDVPSGDYELTFVAYDGVSYSETIRRWIRIDRPEDSLTLVFAWPEGDVGMLLGDRETFLVQVSERFSRPIHYVWTVNGTSVGEDAPVFTYDADAEGAFLLEVEVSSAIANLSHHWAISTRAPANPRIRAISPDLVMAVPKRTTISFSFSVENPDNTACDIIWFKDGAICDGPGTTGYDICMEESGSHKVSVILLWAGGHSEVSWDISVVNAPPMLVSWVPNATITLVRDTTVTFSVSAEDPDGDVLSYGWDSTNLTIVDDGTSGLTVTIPYLPGVDRTVRVSVTDGEDSSVMLWSIESPLEDAPAGIEPAKDPAGVSWLLMALAIAVACAIAVGYYARSRRRNHDGPA